MFSSGFTILTRLQKVCTRVYISGVFDIVVRGFSILIRVRFLYTYIPSGPYGYPRKTFSNNVFIFIRVNQFYEDTKRYVYRCIYRWFLKFRPGVSLFRSVFTFHPGVCAWDPTCVHIRVFEQLLHFLLYSWITWGYKRYAHGCTHRYFSTVRPASYCFVSCLLFLLQRWTYQKL